MVDLAVSVSFCKLIHFGLLIIHLEVYLAAAVVSPQRFDQLAYRNFGVADNVQYVHQGNQARIGVVVVAIIEVAGKLSAEYSV
ncbi:hypothetical protein ES703_80481 [subsurface metagenome]